MQMANGRLRARQSIDYAPSLSSLSAPSSTDSSGVCPTEETVLTLSTNAKTFTTLNSTNKTSLKMGVPNTCYQTFQFSTLLRSSSTKSKAGRRHSVVLSEQAVVNGTEMDDPDRPTRRKSKSDRFYNFLRSGSRSRSSKRTAASTSISEELDSAMPENTQDPHSRNSSWSSASSSQKRPTSSTTASTSKPSNIIQSRPISTTTTATNTTITPPTPKARRQAPSSIPKPLDAPKSPTTTARKRLHNIFRKSSISSSRAASPDHSDEEGDGSTPRPTRNTNLHSRPVSPSPQFPRSRQSSSEPNSSSTTNSSSKLENLFKPTKFFSSSRRPTSPPPPLSLSHSSSIVSPMPTPSSSNSASSNIPIVSGPSKHVSTSKIARRRASTNDSISSSSSLHRPAHVAAPQPRPPQFAPSPIEHTTTSQPVPRITHTPTTPSRSGTAPPRLTHRKDSMDSGYRYRPLLMVDEERDSKELELVVKGKGKELDTSSKGKESENSSASGHKSTSTNHNHNSTRVLPIKSKTSNLTNIRSAKHGFL
ncbi:hypothetical protein BT96DRAFT_984381 [Gymnopus androsaceus JB14]|uniref:Uncharacterized protein n=1 Tax=Gymnopus androsaceus JB14 TaxID=1447944 RepID=A0A6A4IHG4_9AGAR|nr:hypothetical protein BT96DRAFT_984381 [Gymnopus androsaceus JB14]